LHASLQSTWLKLERAREHIEATEKAVDLWLETDAYTISREIDPKTGYTVGRAQINESPPSRISILVGDAIHNLRSALDHTVYSLAESRSNLPLAPEVEEGLMFPIVGNQNRKGQPADGAKIFAHVSSRQLAGIPDEARAFIEQEQPYHWDDGYRFHWLWSLNEINTLTLRSS
jgi:hypothetical protein